MASEFKLPRENEHHEHPTPQEETSYIEGRFPPLRDFVKWSEDGQIKCLAKYRVACKMEDDIDNSLQLQHWQNIALKCLSNNLDDVAKEVHTV